MWQRRGSHRAVIVAILAQSGAFVSGATRLGAVWAPRYHSGRCQTRRGRGRGRSRLATDDGGSQNAHQTIVASISKNTHRTRAQLALTCMRRTCAHPDTFTHRGPHSFTLHTCKHDWLACERAICRHTSARVRSARQTADVPRSAADLALARSVTRGRGVIPAR